VKKAKLATVWLDGCSGCHMSFLDIDERLLDLAELADLVYSPLVDLKEFPEMADVTLIEGAVSSTGGLRKDQEGAGAHQNPGLPGRLRRDGQRAGDAQSVQGQRTLNRAYMENADLNPHIPVEVIPPLLKMSVPVHQVVKVDVFVPGCPPPADTIFYVLTELLAGRKPNMMGKTRFGV
jgi:NAD-reducing hydrogenase small subunit